MRGNAIYKKPVAIVMMLLSIVAAAFYFLFNGLTELIPADLSSVTNALPDLGAGLIKVAFFGIVLVIGILGITGKRGRVAFIFVLIASVINIAEAVLYGDGEAMIKIELVKDIIKDFSKLGVFTYGTYGLLFMAAIFFIVGIMKGKDEMEITMGAAAIPVVYMLLVIVGYVAIVVLPTVLKSFTLPADIDLYVVYGIWGLSVLLPFVGVHKKTLSRGVNAWMLFANAVALFVLSMALLVLKIFTFGRNVALHEAVLAGSSPIVLFFSLAGFTASDLRN